VLPCIKLQPVDCFTDEVTQIVAEARQYAILTSRVPSRLNYILRFPRQAVTGWYLFTPPHQLCGFALLNLLSQYQGQVRVGKIVDCLLTGADVDLWRAAILALKDELTQQGAHVIQAFASTPWLTAALENAGFVARFALEFSLRDRCKLLPQDVPFHLMSLEADYFYT
jgi:hypothetical protein